MNAIATAAAVRPALAAPLKLRAIGRGDAALLGEFMRDLSPQAKRLRFHGAVREDGTLLRVQRATTQPCWTCH